MKRYTIEMKLRMASNIAQSVFQLPNFTARSMKSVLEFRRMGFARLPISRSIWQRTIFFTWW
jgi:hypothetical protein